MRLLYVSTIYKPAYVYGGPARSVPSLCEGLAEAGVDIEVFTTDANRHERLNVPTGGSTLVDGVRVTYFPVVRERYFHAPALVDAVVRRIREFDVVEIDALFSSLLEPVARQCRKAGVPYVVPPRGQLLPRALREKRWKKSLYLRLVGLRTLNTAAAIHCTDAVESDALGQIGVTAPAFVVPNAIERKAGRVPVNGIRSEIGAPESAPLLLFVGRFHRVKRLDVAVATLGALSTAYLLVVGPDEQNLRRELERQAGSLGCADRLRILPLQSGDWLERVYAAADLFILPSDMESFGMAAGEAMAAGLPVLVSDKVPIGRWAEAARAGRTVSNQVSEFAGAVREILTLPREELFAMGARARQCAATHFDRTVVARKFIDHLGALRR